jgi:translation initiation factor 1
MNDNSRLVYSTDAGRIHEAPQEQVRPKGDGIVRVQRQTKGRKGKGVCLVTGIDKSDDELKKITAALKKTCGCGGALKEGVIEIQGDNREKIKTYLEGKGYQVKLAGG